MARERIDLSPVLKRYKTRVIRITPLDNYFLVETDRGLKELRIWPRVDVMHWSFAWREQLARQGNRQVERFIRTRDAKPFVVANKRGFTLTDYYPETEATDFPLPSQARLSGEVIANMHQAQQANHLFFATDLLAREQDHAALETNRAKELQQSFLEGSSTFTEWDKWIAGQFHPLLERMQRSVQLLNESKIEPELLSVSHRRLSRKNWRCLGETLYLRGFYRPVLSVQLRDVASYLRELFTESADEERIQRFMDGYEAVKSLGYEEYKLLLAFLAFPNEAWKSIYEYTRLRLTHEQVAEKEIDVVEQAVQKQRLVDRLLRQIAHRAEQRRSGTANESI